MQAEGLNSQGKHIFKIILPLELIRGLFFQTVPVIIPESVGPWKGSRRISFIPDLASMPVIFFSE